MTQQRDSRWYDRFTVRADYDPANPAMRRYRTFNMSASLIILALLALNTFEVVEIPIYIPLLLSLGLVLLDSVWLPRILKKRT